MSYLLFQGITPLHLAALNGHLPVVVELLTRGANVNEKDDDGVNVIIRSWILISLQIILIVIYVINCYWEAYSLLCSLDDFPNIDVDYYT